MGRATRVLCFSMCFAACGDAEERRVTQDFDFDGTCVRCHTSLSAGQVHPTYKLRCVDCHGGDDQVMEVPVNAASGAAMFRDKDLVKKSHVRPKEKLARFFFANGIDDDGDGVVDEGPTFVDLNLDGVPDPDTTIEDLGEVAELGLQGEGVGQFVDSEYARDLDYLRWVNPGDLRVAQVGCGSLSRLSGQGGGCHASVIGTVRRSMMATNAAVVNGAYYGNESTRKTFQDSRDELGKADDPRAGAFGYVFDYDDVDRCVVLPTDLGDSNGRRQPDFDSACLEALAMAADANGAAGAAGNSGLPAFEAHQGTVTPVAPPGMTAQHVGAKHGRLPWGGKPLGPAASPLAQLKPIPNEVGPDALLDPVDFVLRGFRAYYPLNFPGSSTNQNFTFGMSIRPEIDQNSTANPFGRGHSAGCTGCHMLQNASGQRDGQDLTTKHREFTPATQDFVRDTEGKPIALAGIANSSKQQKDLGRAQQRFYSARHELTTRITTDQCGLCHAFVTRIDLAYQGMFEDEQRDVLARRKPIAFSTRRGTKVVVHDSLVREFRENKGDPPTLVLPSGLAIIEQAKARDAELAGLAFVPGYGGCAPAVFTEDCNNNGELDRALELFRRDAEGKIRGKKTIDEDRNGNGELDLIDHLPREHSVDGRQMRYVYGGANGATRLMDAHFEKGMHCIDCHFLQDNHGDGNLYSSNWDAIEIECEDCHGTLGQRATLVTSGQNGGNDLTLGRDHDGTPFFEKRGDQRIQRSRVTPGMLWEIPQVVDVITRGAPGFSAQAAAAMTLGLHMPAPLAAGEHTTGSTFAGQAGKSPLRSAKLECYTCHNAWVPSCMGCHYQQNFGDKVRTRIGATGLVEKTAGENEAWFNNSNPGGKTDFQLLSFMRSPFVLGINAAADGHRLAPFRSSMQMHLSINGKDGHTLRENMSFTTFQIVDANSGRANVATSAVAMNQTMPHTVRKLETRDCDTCHSLVDKEGRVRNDHLLSQTFGLGAGRYAYTGDWVLVAGVGGLELFDIKMENQLAGSEGKSRFPGIILSPVDRVEANVEPKLDGQKGLGDTYRATDVAFLRNFHAAPTESNPAPLPTAIDLALTTFTDDIGGKLVVSDVSLRGHPTASSRPSMGDESKVFVLELRGTAEGLATLSPDLSDPFVYVADGAAGLSVVTLEAASGPVPAAELGTSVAVAGEFATEVALAGDVAYLGTREGHLVVFDLADPNSPVLVGSVDVEAEVRGIEVRGFFVYVATAAGLAILDIGNPRAPVLPVGAPDVIGFPSSDLHSVFVSSGHAYLALGKAGVLDLDVETPAQPRSVGSLTLGRDLDARDVIVSKVPGQTWVLVADAQGGLAGIKLDNRVSPRERCLPDPMATGCGLDMDYRDATILGRDPSVDPVTGSYLPAEKDPSAKPFFHLPATIATSPRRLARPAIWEQIGTQTGRRLRDSFMPGSGVLSLEVMQRMREVEICEAATTTDDDGNGLGELGLADPSFFDTGTCAPLASP